MAVLPLIDGQLVPPRVQNLLRRQRLKDLGKAMLSHRCTTVVAPAGFGKSVWVSSLLEEPGWPPTAWLSLDHHDADPSTLLYHLIHAVKRVLPEFGEESLRTLTSLGNTTRDWPVATNAFLEELPGDQELVLVLDDVHLIRESTAACAIIEHLLRWLPDSVHLVLIGRSNPPFNLYNQQLSGDLLEIRGGQLLFTPEEARALLVLMGLELSEPAIAGIHAQTEGWAAGLRLVAIRIKQSGCDPGQETLPLKQDGAGLHRYLGTELLETLPGSAREFLLDASLLPYLEADLCDAAFGRNSSRDEIARLYDLGLLSRVDTRPDAEDDPRGTRWHLHHLVGEYLADMASRVRPPEYVAAVRSLAGAYFESRGDIDRAIEQAVSGADWTTAAGLINRHAFEYFTVNARLDALYQWIGQLPPDLVARDHWLLFFKGKSIMQIDDQEAMVILAASADIAARAGDLKCEACCLLAMISSAVFCGDLNKGKEIGRRLLAKPLLMQDAQSREPALTAALWHAMFIDDLHEGLRLSRIALRLKLNPEFRMNALMMSAFIHWRLGNLAQARQLIESALDLPFVKTNDQCLITCHAILILILNMMGDKEAFEQPCREIWRIGQKYHMQIHVGRIYMNRAYFDIREGCFDEARKNLGLAQQYYAAGGGASLVNAMALKNMLPRIRTGENAADLLKEAQDVLARFEAFPYGQGFDYHIYTLVGIVALEAGSLELARQLFERSAGRWRQNGARYNLAGTKLLLAYLHLLQGDESIADSLLRKALAAAEAGQWLNFWEWHDEAIYTVCRRAVLQNIHADWAARLLQRWFPQRSHRELGRLLVSPDERLRSFAASLIQDLASTGATIIHAFFLGGWRLFINGSEVAGAAWKTRRAEKLVKLLVADNRPFTKDELIERLWPGSDPGSGDASLKMTLSYVRKAFEAAGTRESVFMKRGKVYLNPGFEVYRDHELFTDEAGKALRWDKNAGPHAIVALEQAAQVYGGSFLPEETGDDLANNTRLRLQELHLDVLFRLARAHYERDNLAEALQVCRRYLACEPVDEQVVRLSMDILRQMGKRQRALSLYHELQANLAREYDAAPEPETTILFQKICSGSQ